MKNKRDLFIGVLLGFVPLYSMADVISFSMSISEMDNACQVVINEADNGDLSFIKDKSIVVSSKYGSYAQVKSDLSIKKDGLGGKEAYCSVSLFQRYFSKILKFCAPSTISDYDTQGISPKLKNSRKSFSPDQRTCSVGVSRGDGFTFTGKVYSGLGGLSDHCSYMCLIE